MLILIIIETILISIPKLKYTWTINIIGILMITLFTLSHYQLTDFIYNLSKNIILDSLSLSIIILSIWITIIINLASYKIKKSKLFLINTISLLSILVLCFLINNFLTFYITFEASLIPTILLIIKWGYQFERKIARLYIMLYTVLASLPLLTIFLRILNTNFTIKFYILNSLPLTINFYISWTMLIIAFIVKLPLFSIHIWLPKAHVEAPVAGSIVLAAVLLKLGGYGLSRINILIKKQIFLISYTLISIAIIGAIITNTICIRQTDLKALIAYSSVGHIGLIIIRCLSNIKWGQYARLTIIIAHGLTSSLIFILTNLLYEKINTRNIILTNGLLTISPTTSLIWIFGISINIGLPPSLNLIGEITAIISSFLISKSIIILFIASNILTAVYSLYLYSIINHGNQIKLNNPITLISSINLTASLSHIWPLIIIIIIPIKLILWC